MKVILLDIVIKNILDRLTLKFWWMLRSCVKQCEKTGCVGERCFSCCEFSPDGCPENAPFYMPIYLWWQQSNCRSNCRHHCIYAREKERAELGHEPFKYRNKWASQSLYGVQVSCLGCFTKTSMNSGFHVKSLLQCIIV